MACRLYDTAAASDAPSNQVSHLYVFIISDLLTYRPGDEDDVNDITPEAREIVLLH